MSGVLIFAGVADAVEVQPLHESPGLLATSAKAGFSPAAESLVRDAVKGHLDYLEWLGRSLDEAEREAGREGWLGTAQVRSALAAEIGGHGRGRAKVR